MPRYELRDKHDELKAYLSYACAQEIMKGDLIRGYKEYRNGRQRFVVDVGTTFMDEHIVLFIHPQDYLITKR